MAEKKDLSPALLSDLQSQGVDIDRTLRVLELIEPIDEKPTDKTGVLSLPPAADRHISDMTGRPALSMPLADFSARLETLGMSLNPENAGRREGDSLHLDHGALRNFGIRLYPKLAYGVLNGGMATTYTDHKKNRALNPETFDALQGEFEALARRDSGKPKGIGSAYIAADGSPGPSFLLLKMRSLLINALRYRLLTEDRETPLLSFFQMTSTGTDAALAEAYREYREHPLLADLIKRTGIDPTKAEGRKQGFLAALTHSSEGLPRQIFDRAYDRPDTGLALPGGHGENFRVLAPLYRDLRSRGIRYVYLGNVDNLGNTVDPVALALFALRGGELAFEFSWRTPVDVKGGVLVQDEGGRLSVADIGQAISSDELARQEQAGARALFNCATGIFDLDYLSGNIEGIADGIPIRVSDQDKEAGRYAQAEQTTWEVLGLTKNPLILAVAKEKRFLAAKMLMETLLASPVSLRINENPAIPAEFKGTAEKLRRGLDSILETEMGYSVPDSRGVRRPLSAGELEATLTKTGFTAEF